MTRDGAIKWEKEIEALKEGKIIQMLDKYDGEFIDTDFPEFFEDGVYRVKPDSKIDVATDKVTDCVFTNACISSPLIDEFKEHIREALKEVYGDE